MDFFGLSNSVWIRNGHAFVQGLHVNLPKTYELKEQSDKQSAVIFLFHKINILQISLKITCTEQIIQNEEEDISDIDDAEQHNDSFKSSPGKQIIF